jgi:hypothetical protein
MEMATKPEVGAGESVAVERRSRRGHPGLTLLSLALGIIMVGLDGSVVAIANPKIAADLFASLSERRGRALRQFA